MSENLSKLEKVKESFNKLKERKNKFLFFVPDSMGVASGAVIEIYTHANVLKKNGLDVYIFSDKDDYTAPSFLDQDLRSLPHKNLKKSGQNELIMDIEIGPEDFLIIPDFFTNIMETTKKLPCQRIAFVQSCDYLVNSLLPGMRYTNFNIRNVITTSEKLRNFLKEFHGDIYNTKTYKIGIPDYFKPKQFKTPSIGFVVRNAADIHKISRLFFLKYPELQWVAFEDLRGLSREDFSSKLANSVACLWVDRIASHGTVPLEAMAVGTIPVSLVPDIVPEYVQENTGVWVNSIYQLPDLLAKVIKMHLEDAIPDEMYGAMDKMAKNYTQNESEASILKIYEEFLIERENEYVQFIQSEEASEQNNLK